MRALFKLGRFILHDHDDGSEAVERRSEAGEPMVADAEGVFRRQAKLAVERRSERVDTAYSPRFREEEPSAAANERGRA